MTVIPVASHQYVVRIYSFFLLLFRAVILCARHSQIALTLNFTSQLLISFSMNGSSCIYLFVSALVRVFISASMLHFYMRCLS